MHKPYPLYRHLFWLIPLLLSVGMLVYLAVFLSNYRRAIQQAEPPVETLPVQPAPPVVVPEPALPASALLSVPFTVQAPLGNWDALHEEACEEASLMMVKYYFNNQAFGSPQQVDQEIKDLVSWETAHGYQVDLTASELVTVAQSYYGLTTGRVLTDPTVEDIKHELANGNLVVVPAAGQILPNPYFTPPGPVYHMLVIKGYSETEFITNDPGTKHGDGFRYLYQDLLGANHSWNADNILQGEKQIIVFSAQ